MNKRLFLTVAILGGAVFAQTSEKRIVNIQGAPRGDLRNGPLTFVGSPLKATISTLEILASQAVMSAPKGKAIVDAKGERTTEFTGKVQVGRGKLAASGDTLTYSEATGQGVLTGNAGANFTPNDSDPVSIKASQLSLDVDTNISTSTGNVKLISGSQTGEADKLVFDEDKELAQFTGNASLTRAAKGNQKELIINSKEIRAITKTKTLYFVGDVKLTQGTTVTTGNAVYYDDKKNVAYIVGNAVSKDTKSKVTLKANILEQRTDLVRVREVGNFQIPVEDFKMRGEK